MPIVEGVALYLRKIEAKRHGTPRQFAARCKNLGLSWMAIAGPWQELRKNGRVESRLINSVKQCRDYADALHAVGVVPYVWGYPWQGHEQAFVEQLLACAGPRGLVLLDPELGSNPTRSTKPTQKCLADQSATDLVRMLRDGGAQRVGLSTFGVVPRWFPLRAFLRAGVDFVGGQTYTDDTTVDRSIASFTSELKAVGRPDVQLVPNFGLYSWAKKPDGKPKARAKTPQELRSHLMEFIDDGEPIHGLIGWAENFLSKTLEPELPAFAELMRRGATTLPVA